jgi:glutathione S-transferase
MPILVDSDIKTREVLDWTGVHLFHYHSSTCSQKLRIALRLKGVDYEPHHVDLGKKEQLTKRYMGINPRGLVPTLVHDGQVIIESNDIVEYLERTFPAKTLVPSHLKNQIDELLQIENDLHLDIRALSMRFAIPTFLAKRSQLDLSKYKSFGAGTVGGSGDPHKAVELKFWQGLNENNGVTDEQVTTAYYRFHTQLERLEEGLAKRSFLLGEAICMADIAWFIYVHRLLLTGYPLAQLHPQLNNWFAQLNENEIFREEVSKGLLMRFSSSLLAVVQGWRKSSLRHVVAGSTAH